MSVWLIRAIEDAGDSLASGVGQFPARVVVGIR